MSNARRGVAAFPRLAVEGEHLVVPCEAARGAIEFPNADPAGPGRKLQALGGEAHLFPCLDAIRDDLGEENESADLAARLVPGSCLPLEPIGGAVLARERLLVAALHRPGEDALVDVLPALRHLREDLVMGPADDVPGVQVVVLHPFLADLKVAHLGVQHGDGRGGVPDELPKERFICREALPRLACAP